MKRALFVSIAAVLALACKQSAPAPTAETPPPATTPGKVQPAPAPTTGSAAAADPWTKTPTKKDPLTRPFFWAIEKDGKTSYALGTIHIGVDAEARLPQIVWDKLDAAKAFAMETDLTDPALQKIIECNNCSLKRELGPVYWKKLEDILGPAVAARIEPMKPMVAATMMSLRGLPMTTQMDTLLLARAQNGKKTIVYLEEAKDEAAILEKWMNVKALKSMLDDIEWSDNHTKAMLAAYIAGDDKKMIAMSDEERAMGLKRGYTAKELDESMQDLLYTRNANWIAPIEKAHAAGGAFIAVGAMHLVGPKNVLELLEKKGYKITRVTP
ncbi:MAG: TraB/GumN family protein [Deltaproteobacteria bacterium]|nr:TraB/GumN family protein [Deltaproteobacteria bacterium]